MYYSSEEFTDRIYLSYEKILKRFELLDIKTKSGNTISHMDLRYAIKVMVKKHPTCRWKSKRIKSKRYYILFEGYLWLLHVYFQKEKSLIDADIYFFETRIKEYEKKLNVESKNLFSEDIYVENLNSFFDRKQDTVRKAIDKMNKIYPNFRYIKNSKYIISKEGIEWLCKNCFKQKYLELLEAYKMELTEQYIQAGYLYDYFFRYKLIFTNRG